MSGAVKAADKANRRRPPVSLFASGCRNATGFVPKGYTLHRLAIVMLPYYFILNLIQVIFCVHFMYEKLKVLRVVSTTVAFHYNNVARLLLCAVS